MWDETFDFRCLYCEHVFKESAVRIERGWLGCPRCKEKKMLKQIDRTEKIDFYQEKKK